MKEKLYFHDIKSISHIPYKNGIGEGVLTHYLDDGLAFDTIIWSEYRNGTLHFEWIPIKEDKNIKEVVWPSPMEFVSIRFSLVFTFKFTAGTAFTKYMERRINKASL